MQLPNVNPQFVPSQNGSLRGVNAVDYQAARLAMTLKSTNAKFAEFIADLAIRLESVVSPSLSVKSGVYEAFGNNFVTRGGMAAMDSVLGATEGIFGTKEQENEPEKKDSFTLAVEKQTKILVDLISSMKGDIKTSTGTDLVVYEDKFKDISDALKKLADKECCDDSEVISRLDALSDKVQLIVDAITGREIDDGRKKHHKMNPTTKLMIETDKKQLSALNNISKILTTHTKIFDKMPQEKISNIEDVFESSQKKISTNNFIDVEAREVKEKETDEKLPSLDVSGILATMASLATTMVDLVKKAGTSLVSVVANIVKRIASFFGGKNTAAAKVVSALPKMLTGKIGRIAGLLGIGAGVYATSESGAFDDDKKEEITEPEKNLDFPMIVPPVIPLPKKTPLPDVDPVTGKSKAPVPTTPTPEVKEGKLAKIGKKFSKALKFLPGVGLVLAGASVYDGVSSAGKIFGTDSTTLAQDVSAGIGGLAENVTFGLLDKEEVAKKTHGLYTSMTESDANKQKEIERLEQRIDDQTASPRKTSGECSPTVINNVTNNAQTFMSQRKYVENNDASYRRYIDSVFKTC